MIDITEKGYKSLTTLKDARYNTLSPYERVMLTVLHSIWDERELVGGPIDKVDTYSVINTLTKRNPSWPFSDIRRTVIQTVKGLLSSEHIHFSDVTNTIL